MVGAVVIGVVVMVVVVAIGVVVVMVMFNCCKHNHTMDSFSKNNYVL